MPEVQWFEDHYIDEDGKRFALEVPWRPEWSDVLHIPEFLLLTNEQRRAMRGEPPVTATVIKPAPALTQPGEHRYRVYLQGELPAFGSGWHTLRATVGKKWVRLENEKGRVRRIKTDQFNLLNPEILNDGEQRDAAQVHIAQGGDGGVE